MASDFQFCEALEYSGATISDYRDKWKDTTVPVSQAGQKGRAARNNRRSYANVTASELRAVEQVRVLNSSDVLIKSKHFVFSYIEQQLDKLNLVKTLACVWIASAVLIFFFSSYAFVLPLVLSTMYLGSYLLSKLVFERKD